MIHRLLAIVQRVRSGPQTVAGRRVVGIIGATTFVVISFLAYRSLPPRTEPVQWGVLLALVIVGGPAMLLVATAEYRQMANLVDVHVPWKKAMNITIAATAANLLPVPGSVLVRTVDLKQKGATTRQIAAAVSVQGATFVGCSAAAASVALWTVGQQLASLALVAIGVGATGAAVLICWREMPGSPVGSVAKMVRVEIAVVGVIMGRIWIVLLAIGTSAPWSGAVMLGSASVVSSAIAVFPGGLGLREGLSGILGATVGVEVSTGVLAAGVDRVTFLVALAAITLATGLGRSDQDT